MWRVFNMGIGFVLVIKPDDEANILEQLRIMNYEAHSLGTIQERKDGEDSVEFVL